MSLRAPRGKTDPARAALLLTLAAALILFCHAGAAAGRARQTARHPDHPTHSRGGAQGESGPPPPPGGGRVRRMKPGIPDVAVLDQDGRRRLFYTDLIKGRKVVIGSFFTSCTYICLAQGRAFSALQAELGNRVGEEVHLILITRDPWVDTPQVLKKWGEGLGMRPGWTLVTGEPEALKKLIAFFYTDTLGQQELHSSKVFIGDEAADRWIVTNGLAAPQSLVEDIDLLSR